MLPILKFGSWFINMNNVASVYVPHASEVCISFTGDAENDVTLTDADAEAMLSYLDAQSTNPTEYAAALLRLDAAVDRFCNKE